MCQWKEWSRLWLKKMLKRRHSCWCVVLSLFTSDFVDNTILPNPAISSQFPIFGGDGEEDERIYVVCNRGGQRQSHRHRWPSKYVIAPAFLGYRWCLCLGVGRGLGGIEKGKKRKDLQLDEFENVNEWRQRGELTEVELKVCEAKVNCSMLQIIYSSSPVRKTCNDKLYSRILILNKLCATQVTNSPRKSHEPGWK